MRITTNLGPVQTNQPITEIVRLGGEAARSRRERRTYRVRRRLGLTTSARPGASSKRRLPHCKHLRQWSHNRGGWEPAWASTGDHAANRSYRSREVSRLVGLG